MATLSNSLVRPGTSTIRRVAKNLYDDRSARLRLMRNLQVLIRTAEDSENVIAERSGCSIEVVHQAANAQLIPYDDVVLLAVHFKTRALTLLSEDVASRLHRTLYHG